jgi:hypothetical protein
MLIKHLGSSALITPKKIKCINYPQSNINKKLKKNLKTIQKQKKGESSRRERKGWKNILTKHLEISLKKQIFITQLVL